ncbi:MAG TPA: hypothetical protein PLS08_12550 [Chryseolinea sp.]|nr:hypothetical protein [Chryseolinea sp.]
MKDAFKDAEVTPSENVWTNIELDLEKADGGDIRRRLFYYKMVAAASVIFALAAGSAALYVLNTSLRAENQQALLTESQSKNTTKDSEKILEASVSAESNSNQRTEPMVLEKGRGEENNFVGNNNDTEKRNTDFENEGRKTIHKSATSNYNQTKTNSSLASNKMNPVNTNSIAQEDQHLTNQNNDRNVNDDQMVFQSHSVKTLSNFSSPKRLNAIDIKQEKTDVQPDAGALLLAKLAQREQELQGEEKENKKEDRSERLWTSLGVAAGAFSAANTSVSPPSNSSIGTSNSLANNVQVANKQAKASGSTYSVGINIGTKLSNRWIIQGGLNYMMQGSDYTSNAVVTSPDFKNFGVASLNDLARESFDAQLVSTSPYQVNNILQYINVPIQTGYILVNRKVGVQLNTGISTDLFLQNTLTPEGGNLDKTTQGSGSESPYRTVNFSGLVGTEISYKMGQHYRIALNPGLRYPFSSIYKSDVGISASPLTFDVGLRFRYIFR